jgi:hypothetical protein
MMLFLVFVIVVLLVILPLSLYARRIEKRVGPRPEKRQDLADRFHFKFGGEPPTYQRHLISP